MKTQINYLYFICFFLFLLTLTFSHFFRLSQPLLGVHLFFLLYALGQALLEVLCFMFVGYFLRCSAPKWAFKIFISISFAFLLAHFANFTMVRVLDTSLSYFFKFFIGSGLDHFRVAFLAMNMNSTMIATIVLSVILVPILGVVFYWLTQKISEKKPLILSLRQLFASVITFGALLLVVDFLAQPYLSSDLYNKYQKTLPLGAIFFSPIQSCLTLAQPIRSSREESKVQHAIESSTFTAASRPNIYLFVIETLRRDFINGQIAPVMQAFSTRHIAPELTVSNANSTHLSWFSIFHSCYPYHWTHVRDHCSNGSPPLQILKKLGYRIRVYSSADLSYFYMDQSIFGKDLSLANSIVDFSKERQLAPCERDTLAMQALAGDVKNEREGTLFIVFLDSTHSEYSSPPDCQPFQPAATGVDYLAISRSTEDLDQLKNRYRNSIQWVDHMLGNFFNQLDSLSLYDDALIALTGDHGEEFFEEGALFHGTHLNDYQTRVPLFYKFPGDLPGPISKISTHIDIFPSILHFLTGEVSWKNYCDGESLFNPERWPYVLTVQHNGMDIPYEFSLSDGKTKLLARFLNPPHIHTIPGIELLAMEVDGHREPLPTEEKTRQHLTDAFDHLIESF
jgi:glucan phosphoethanolaminetransferase (alkaline phosphatase superfamily)